MPVEDVRASPSLRLGYLVAGIALVASNYVVALFSGPTVWGFLAVIPLVVGSILLVKASGTKLVQTKGKAYTVNTILK